jgi:tRNA nucleotidyltransferase (CCA-adding enzyme)
MAEAQTGWEHFPHGADVGLCGYGPMLETAFEQTATAMSAAVTDPSSIRTRDEVHIECEAPDPELLLIDWLNALIYEMATRGMLFGRFEVHIEGDRLTATAWGEPLSRERHAPTVEVKGATYTALKVEKREDGSWVAQCVVDV